MKFKILLFASVADVMGDSIVIVENVNNSESLVKVLHERFPVLSDLKYALAVNKVIVHGNTVLNEGDEIALLPPFAGG